MRAILLSMVLLISCGPKPPPDPPPSPAGCDGACATLERLGCPEAAPTDDGVSCAELCAVERMVDQYDLSCAAALTECDLESCAR